MIHAYWNALRVHDQVVVHDDGAADFALSPGVVVNVASRHDATTDSNRVTFRVNGRDGVERIARPKRLAVHLAGGDDHGGCWRCAATTN